MSLVASVRKQLSPIHPEGFLFIASFAVLTVILFYFSAHLGWIGLILTAWCAYFFRDPARVTPQRDGLVVAPADGYVSRLGHFVPPPELGLGEAPMQCVSIFMSVFDCHVNRAPVAGRVSRVAYKPGIFLNADLDKASEDNERNGLLIETQQGRFGVVQIAGLIARRIVCFSREGDQVSAGQRFGLIRFGSRVDVYMPDGVHLLVGAGQKTIAGETVIGDFLMADGQRTYHEG